MGISLDNLSEGVMRRDTAVPKLANDWHLNVNVDAIGVKHDIKSHLNSKSNTVLISPSMSEGVDLKGNLSTFQIICKVPFPYLGDKVTRKKMNKWKWWYNTETVRTIIQSLGRSIRCESDVAVTYILDGDWNRIRTNCKSYFPEGFFDNYHEY